HLALIGVVALAAAAVDTFAERARSGNMRVGMANAALVVIAGALAIKAIALSRQQSAMYIDQITLYETTLRRNPHSWLALTNLGSVWNEKQRPMDAIPLLRRALRLRPDLPEIEFNLGVAHQLVAEESESNGTPMHRQAAEDFAAAAKIRPDW